MEAKIICLFVHLFQFFLTRNLEIRPFHWRTTEVVDVMEEIAAAWHGDLITAFLCVAVGVKLYWQVNSPWDVHFVLTRNRHKIQCQTNRKKELQHKAEMWLSTLISTKQNRKIDYLFKSSKFWALLKFHSVEPLRRRTHLKLSVVVIRVFGFSDLHRHAGLLHELAGSERQTAQHAGAAALQHPLQNLIKDGHNHISLTCDIIWYTNSKNLRQLETHTHQILTLHNSIHHSGRLTLTNKNPPPL